MLERFEFNIPLWSLGHIHEWVHQTLQTITSAKLNEFTVWVLHTSHPWGLQCPMNVDGWRAVDTSLNILAERNPNFRVVFRGDFDSFRHGVRAERDTLRWLMEEHLPLVSSKGLVKYEQVHHIENRFWKSRIL